MARAVVNLTVLAGSALTLAASWLGVTLADAAGDASAVDVATAASEVAPDDGLTPPAIPAPAELLRQATAREAEAAQNLVPAPTTRTRTIVIRRSRAS